VTEIQKIEVAPSKSLLLVEPGERFDRKNTELITDRLQNTFEETGFYF
jgi:hypothetical protein